MVTVSVASTRIVVAPQVAALTVAPQVAALTVAPQVAALTVAPQVAAMTVALAGTAGPRGLSAYQVAVAAGFVGDEAAWLASLVGDDGDPGDPGASAYQVAVAAGFVGDEAAWLASLAGADFDPAIVAEIEAARGDRSALGLRIATISNFASPNAGGVIVGQYYDNAFHGTNASTLAGAANRVQLQPFYTSVRLRIDQIGVAISTAGSAGALGKCCIYGSDAEGWPDALLLEPEDTLAVDSTGAKMHSVDFTFDAGRQYWLGFRWSATGTVRSLNVASAVNLGLSGSTATTYFNAIRRTVTFASALPDPWVFDPADLVTGNPVSVRMRAAAPA